MGKWSACSGLDGAHPLKTNVRRMLRGVDESAVGRWLLDHIEDLHAPLRYELIAGGRSNLTYLVTDARGRRVVLRRPPLGHVLATAHDMAREHRIISAVGHTSVPVPRALALCEDCLLYTSDAADE